MLFAETDNFWKSPSVYDLLGLVGLVVGFYSIWLAIKYASRDLNARIAEAEKKASEAARDEVRRVAKAILQLGVAATIRSLELAREACNGRRCSRAIDLCLLAQEQMVKILSHSMAHESERAELLEVSDLLSDIVRRLRKVKESNPAIPEAVTVGLDRSLLALHKIEGRITEIKVEDGHG